MKLISEEKKAISWTTLKWLRGLRPLSEDICKHNRVDVNRTCSPMITNRPHIDLIYRLMCDSGWLVI